MVFNLKNNGKWMGEMIFWMKFMALKRFLTITVLADDVIYVNFFHIMLLYHTYMCFLLDILYDGPLIFTVFLALWFPFC